MPKHLIKKVVMKTKTNSGNLEKKKKTELKLIQVNFLFKPKFLKM